MDWFCNVTSKYVELHFEFKIKKSADVFCAHIAKHTKHIYLKKDSSGFEYMAEIIRILNQYYIYDFMSDS